MSCPAACWNFWSPNLPPKPPTRPRLSQARSRDLATERSPSTSPVAKFHRRLKRRLNCRQEFGYLVNWREIREKLGQTSRLLGQIPGLVPGPEKTKKTRMVSLGVKSIQVLSLTSELRLVPSFWPLFHSQKNKARTEKLCETAEKTQNLPKNEILNSTLSKDARLTKYFQQVLHHDHHEMSNCSLKAAKP